MYFSSLEILVFFDFILTAAGQDLERIAVPIAEDPHSPVSRLTAASGLVSLLEKAGY